MQVQSPTIAAGPFLSLSAKQPPTDPPTPPRCSSNSPSMDGEREPNNAWVRCPRRPVPRAKRTRLSYSYIRTMEITVWGGTSSHLFYVPVHTYRYSRQMTRSHSMIFVRLYPLTVKCKTTLLFYGAVTTHFKSNPYRYVGLYYQNNSIFDCQLGDSTTSLKANNIQIAPGRWVGPAHLTHEREKRRDGTKPSTWPTKGKSLHTNNNKQ